MKKYFAKFLAVEGYIKEEDFYFANNELFRADSKFKPDNRNNPNGRGYKKVKLFLCSRDIPESYSNPHVDYWDGVKEEDRYRVIGEILTSNIKEGQEFSEEGVKSLSIGE